MTAVIRATRGYPARGCRTSRKWSTSQDGRAEEVVQVVSPERERLFEAFRGPARNTKDGSRYCARHSWR